jgi:hypothetical protein
MVDASAPVSLNEPPPNSTEASELLVEFCSLQGMLELEHEPNNQQSELSPPMAAFIAALALPFYRDAGLHPQFPLGRLCHP